ncbi:MAG: hypothetical protein HWD59_01375 [Coxiellaceae bacterium]|nr:MAG: hypothetical protein HWD59_01375 [Coxiellaceae bacterium]
MPKIKRIIRVLIVQYIQLIHAAREYYDEDNEQKALTLLLIALRQHPEKANAYKCIYSWYLSSSRCSSYLDNIITALNNITAEKIIDIIMCEGCHII